MTLPSILDRRSFMAGGAILTVTAALLPGFDALGSNLASSPPFSAKPEGLHWFATLPGETVAIHVASKQVGGHFAVLESIAAPGAGTPLHIHRSADEYFFIQEGQMHFVCDGVEFDAVAGTSVVIPRGTTHSWANMSDTRVRSLVTFTPGGVEQMFTELAAAFPDGIEAVAGKYDTFLAK